MLRIHTIRRGFSMIELLIVVAISMLLIAIAIPFIRPALASNKLREAARQVNTYLVGAKARAAENGRPFGVRLVRSWVDQTGDPNECYRLQYVEVPPYYSGDVEGALITVGGPGGPAPSPPPPTQYEFFASVPNNDPASLSLALVPTDTSGSPLVTPGDLIRFSYSGVWYRIIDIFQGQGHTAANDTVLRLSVLANPALPPVGVGNQPWPSNPSVGVNQPFAPKSQSLPYQIFRRPRVAGSATLELPRDTSIDLSLSGFGGVGNQFVASSVTDQSPVDIVFDPSGRVAFLSFQGSLLPAPTESIYLMVGNTDQVWPRAGLVKANGLPANIGQPAIFPSDPDDFPGNIANSETFWVGVQQTTGSILTAENLGAPSNSKLNSSGTPITNLHGYFVPDIGLARDFVRSGVSKGSR